MSRDEDVGPRDERELLEDIEDALRDLVRAQTILAMTAAQLAAFRMGSQYWPSNVTREARELWDSVMGDDVDATFGSSESDDAAT